MMEELDKLLAAYAAARASGSRRMGNRSVIDATPSRADLTIGGDADDPLIPALQQILDEMRRQSPRLLTYRLQAIFIRDRLFNEGFDWHERPGGLGR